MLHFQHFAESKFVQSITAFCCSFFATLIDPDQVVGNTVWWITFGQLVTIYGGIAFGTIRFWHYLKDRKNKIKTPKK